MATLCVIPDAQHGDFAPWINPAEGFAVLLTGPQIDRFSLIRRFGLFERHMGSHRAGAGKVVQRQHVFPPGPRAWGIAAVDARKI
jgi:hypothetical protein